MAQQASHKRPLHVNLLAAAPGVLLATVSWVQDLEAGRQVTTAIGVVTALVVLLYVAASLRARRIPTWTFAGIGLVVPVIFSRVWGALLPWLWDTARTQPLFRVLNVALNLLLVGVLAALVWAAMRRARSAGPAAAMLLVGPLIIFAYWIMDPNYGLIVLVENRLLLAVINILPLLPAFVVLPLWVLNASTVRSQVWGLLTMSFLSLEIMALIPIAADIGRVRTGMPNAPPLATAIPRTIIVGTLFAVFFWGLLALAVFLVRRKYHPPERLAA